ncbi:MAG: hypothetical protein KAG56_09045 [Sulfurovaceae bacterium]|nr:hypothetical protein [Sulfurovaceae bacterium]
MKKLNEKQVWKQYFSTVIDKPTLDLLKQLKCLKTQNGLEYVSDKETRDEALSLIRKLEGLGVDPYHSVLYKLTQNNKISITDIYKEFNFSESEKIQLLTQLFKYGTNSYNSLDLSRQFLDFIPKEISLVNKDINFTENTDGTDYVAIDLSYNDEIKNFSKEDMLAINHFDVFQFISFKGETLTPDIKYLTNVIVINLSYARLLALPDEIYTLSGLYSLRINWTPIETISMKIKGLNNLVDIEISETSIGKELWELDYGEDEFLKNKELISLQNLLKEMQVEVLY